MDNESLDVPFHQLQSSPKGLTGEQAQRRLAEVGPNDPTPKKQISLLVQVLSFFNNPLVIILLIASVISAALGDIINASIIAIMVLLSVAINFFQTYRSQKAVDELRKGMAPTATVLRDGKWQELPRVQVVPGDIIRLSAGDLIPGDARLIESKDLHVQQSALTGESLPAEKESRPAGDPASPDQSDMVFFGTSVVNGSATALVVKTGTSTQFGEIAVRLVTRRPETEFERGTRNFGLLIMRTVFFLVIFVVFVNVLLHRNTFESLLFAVALAVGLPKAG